MQSSTLPQENKMGTMPVNRLLVSMSLPMMASMLIQALYNIVDSIFVAKISENALAAVSLAFPVQNLMLAVTIGTGVGMNALLSKSLGEKNYEEANRAANNGAFLTVLSYLAFALCGLFLSRLFFQVQTGDPEIIAYGASYLFICLIGSFGLCGQILFERLLQSTGRTFYNMVTQGLGAVINIILDPILIFGLLGLPAMGVAGAALATVIGQIIAMLLGLWFNQRKNPEITLRIKGFRPNRATIGRIYAVGLPSIIMQSIGSIMTFGMNKILLAFSTTATAVFGVYFKLQSFVFMPVFGLNNGMIPIVAYNYGARSRARIVKAFSYSVWYATGIMVLGFALFQLVPQPLLTLFNASPAMLSMGVPALRIICVSFLAAGFNIMAGSLFQALGRGMSSLIVSLVRQLLVLLPVAWVFSLTGNLNLVWWSFPIAEAAALVLSVYFLRRLFQTVLSSLS